MNDSDFVLLALKGEEEGFKRLFELHYFKVFKIALAYSDYDGDEARDISQKSFIQAFRKLDKLDDPEKFGPWIMKITRNIALSHIRQKKSMNKASFVNISAIDEHLWTCNDFEEEQLRRKDIEAVREIIGSIPDRSNRETVQMFYQEGLDTKRIAQQQGISRSTVTTRLSRFRAKYLKILLQRILLLRGED